MRVRYGSSGAYQASHQGAGGRQGALLGGADGRVAVSGMTLSSDLPATAGAFDGTTNGHEDMFVAVYDDIPFD